MTHYEQEQELKLALDEANYRKLLEQFPPRRIVRQTNHYIDTDDFAIASRRITLRLRQEDDAFLLQCKVKQPSMTEGLTNAREYELELSEQQAMELLAHPQQVTTQYGEQLSMIHEPNLVYQGAIRNERAFLNVPHSTFSFELDCTTFPDGSIDYELEVEHLKDTHDIEAVKLLLSHTGVAFGGDPGGKYRRFRGRLRR